MDMTPTSPRLLQESARERSEALADAWQSHRDLFDCSPNNAACRSPRSPRRSFQLDAVEERGRRRSDGAASPRSPNRSFQVSEDWMRYSSGATDREGRDGCHEKTAAVEGTMPSSNLSTRVRRQQSGRITENSDNWLRAGGESSRPGPPVITNSENYNPSKGKKTGFVQEPSNVKRRLQMDATQAESLRSQRRHEFAEASQPLSRQLSPRPPEQPAACDTTAGSGGGHTQGGTAVGVQHRTSAEMAASIMPERSVGAEVASPEQRKYMVGNEIVDWQKNGRRTGPACVQKVVQGSLSQKAMSMVNLRDHRNSDVVREQLQTLPAEASPEHPRSQRIAPCVQPPVYLTPYVQQVSPRVFSFGEYSSLPSTMQKDTAYLQSGLKIVKYSTRSPGTFSPNVPRAPAAQVLQC